ncbi:MAG: hypothetical protein Q4B54_04920 [Coriobacteriales bacterium]|nr:hypothetical protein [Coriobacteriales bacterium]
MFDVDNIPPETLEKARQCKSADELFELAKSEGIDLDDEMIEGISGGIGSKWGSCPSYDPFI